MLIYPERGKLGFRVSGLGRFSRKSFSLLENHTILSNLDVTSGAVAQW